MKETPSYTVKFSYDMDDNLCAEVYWGIQTQHLVGQAHAFTRWGATNKAKRIIRQHKRLAKRGIFLRG